MKNPRLPLLTKFKRNEIAALFKNASLLFKTPFFLLLSARTQLEYGRLLLVVPKKIGSAPIRNKLRRRLKAIFYENRLYELKKDIIFIAKQKEVNLLSFDELRDIVVREMKKNL